MTALRCSPAVSATVAGESASVAPDRAATVTPVGADHDGGAVADVAHGTAGSVVVATAARA